MEGPDGERIAFTRSERRVLAVLTQHRDRVVTRDQLLDAIVGPGSDSRDRNIDFLINRLRRKLSDDARHPQFIATRYGEGYIWIGIHLAGLDASQMDAYLVVGPVRGTGNLADRAPAAENFASQLHAALRSELPPEKPVVLAPDCPPPADFPDTAPLLSVELSFFEENGAINCVASARQFRSRRALAVSRVVLPGDAAATTTMAAGLAKSLLLETWRALATQTEDGIPVPVLMQLASAQTVVPGHGSADDSDEQLQQVVSRHERRTLAAWTESGTRLRRLLEARPDDAILKVMYATHLHSKYVHFGYMLFQKGIDDRAEDEDRIEALVLEALPHIQSHPEYALMAAKLLHFVQRGYLDLARELSEQAYAASVSVAGSLAIIGQFRAFAGETDAALRCLDQALNLTAPGSPAHFYTLTLKLQALHAAGDFVRLHDAKRELYRQSVALMLFYEPLFAHPEKLSIRARAVMLALSERKAAALLLWQNYVSARLFHLPDHRANAIQTLLGLVVRRFGRGAVPNEIARTHSGLLDRLG